MIPNWMQSSVSADQVSATVRGAIIAASSVIVFAGVSLLHLNLDANDVVGLATSLGAIAGAIWSIHGLIVKLLVKTTS